MAAVAVSALPPLRLLLAVLAPEVLLGAFAAKSFGRCLFKASSTLAAFRAFKFIPLLAADGWENFDVEGVAEVAVAFPFPFPFAVAVAVADAAFIALASPPSDLPPTPLLIATAADHFKSAAGLGTGAGRKLAIVGTPDDDDTDELVRSL